MARLGSTRKFALIFLVGLLLLPQAVGGTRQAGVKSGDWGRYVVDQHATRNTTLVRNYQEQYIAYANASYVRLNVTQVVGGTNVSLIEDIHYTNGNDARIQSLVDITQGFSTDNPPRVLMANMPILTFSSIGNFSYVPRTVNNLEVDSSSGGNSSALRYSWDEVTGILLSEQFVYNVAANDTNSGTFTYTLAMMSTNLWHYVPPQQSPKPPPLTQPQNVTFVEIYSLAGIVVALAVGVFAFARRRSPKKNRR